MGRNSIWKSICTLFRWMNITYHVWNVYKQPKTQKCWIPFVYTTVFFFFHYKSCVVLLTSLKKKLLTMFTRCCAPEFALALLVFHRSGGICRGLAPQSDPLNSRQTRHKQTKTFCTNKEPFDFTTNIRCRKENKVERYYAGRVPLSWCQWNMS